MDTVLSTVAVLAGAGAVCLQTTRGVTHATPYLFSYQSIEVVASLQPYGMNQESEQHTSDSLDGVILTPCPKLFNFSISLHVFK